MRREYWELFDRYEDADLSRAIEALRRRLEAAVQAQDQVAVDDLLELIVAAMVALGARQDISIWP